LLQDTRTTIELMERLSEIYPELGKQQRIFAREALGLSRGADLLLRGGRDALEQHLADAYKRGVVDDERGERAQEHTRVSNNLDRNIGQIWDNFWDAMLPGFTKAKADIDQSLIDWDAREKVRVP